MVVDDGDTEAVLSSRVLRLRDRSPILPQEILNSIVGHVDDTKTLMACALSGRPLRLKAHQNLFADIDVRFSTSTRGKENVGRLLQRYRSTDLAKHARRLRVTCKSYSISSSQLMDLVSMLATWTQESHGLGKTFWQHPRPSLIHSLKLDFLPLSTDELLCVLWAFPRLSTLECRCSSSQDSKESQMEQDAPWKRLSPPRFLRLKFVTLAPWSAFPIMELFFPEGTPVHIRSLSVTAGVEVKVLRSIMERAEELEELDLWQDVRFLVGVPQKHSIDLRANTRLRHLTFSILGFNGDCTPQHMLSCLRTSQAGSLEQITFWRPTFMNTARLDPFFKELDDLLDDKAVFGRLRSVSFDRPSKLSDPDFEPADLDGALRRWLPRLHQRGILSLVTLSAQDVSW